MGSLRSTRPATWLAASALALFGAAACNSILGFDERTFDPCAQYCTSIIETCKDTFKQYQSEEICLASCALLDPGSSTDGNTVACRQAHVDAAGDLAQADRGEQCHLAGLAGTFPDGSAGCADRCELYCSLMAEVCSETALGSADPEDCATQCTAVPVNASWTAADPELKDHDNSIDCRFWHLANATDGAEHCAHADGTVKCEGIAMP
jgi:hypothetical protein